MHDALSERVGVVYEEFTPEQISDIKREVRSSFSDFEGCLMTAYINIKSNVLNISAFR